MFKKRTNGVLSSFHLKIIVGYFKTEQQKMKPDRREEKQTPVIHGGGTCSNMFDYVLKCR
jgi:hypothetical protein